MVAPNGRLARIVIPGVAHHVTRRGNRRLPISFSDEDRQAYLGLLAEAAATSRTRCLAWCLMDNHVHLILVPESADGLRAMLREAHRCYTRRVNFREGWRGYLFQGRFASYPMDDAHLIAAVRYAENNPVAAKMVARAGLAVVEHAQSLSQASACRAIRADRYRGAGRVCPQLARTSGAARACNSGRIAEGR